MISGSTLTKDQLREGQIWDEVLGGPVNGISRKIVMIGTDRLMYEDDYGVRRSVQIRSFIRWAKREAECNYPE